jgi:hypothetical protein
MWHFGILRIDLAAEPLQIIKSRVLIIKYVSKRIARLVTAKSVGPSSPFFVFSPIHSCKPASNSVALFLCGRSPFSELAFLA